MSGLASMSLVINAIQQVFVKTNLSTCCNRTETSFSPAGIVPWLYSSLRFKQKKSNHWQDWKSCFFFPFFFLNEENCISPTVWKWTLTESTLEFSVYFLWIFGVFLVFDDPANSSEIVFFCLWLHVWLGTWRRVPVGVWGVWLRVYGVVLRPAAVLLINWSNGLFDSYFLCHDYHGAVPAGLILQGSTRPAAVTLFHVVSTACMKQDLNKKNLFRIQVLVYTVHFHRHLLRITFLKGSYHGLSI